MREVRKKIVLLGNVGVGKTSLFSKFLYDEFSKIYLSSVGVQVDKRVVEIDDTKVILMVWDLAGEIFESKMYTNYLRGAHGVLGVFDTTRASSLAQTIVQIGQVQESMPECQSVIIGNKMDLLSDAQKAELKAKPEVSLLTSAKTGEQVEAAFLSVATKMLPV